MQIVCPSCSNRLQVDAVMATGKTFRVRCSRCENRFEVDRLSGRPTGAVLPPATLAGVMKTPPEGTPAGSGAAMAGTSSSRARFENRGTTVVGAPYRTTSETPKPSSMAPVPAKPRIEAGPQLEEFRRTLPQRYQQMLQRDELALLGVDEASGDVDVLHAYLRISEEWRPARYEGFLNAAEMEMVRMVSGRLDQAYNDVGELARRRRIDGQTGLGISSAPPRTGPLPSRSSTPAPSPSAPSTATLPGQPPTSAVGSFPKEVRSATVFLDRGLDAFKASRFLEAKEQFQHCISLDPKRAEGHYRLGLTLVRIGEGNGHTDWAAVEKCYTTAIDASPDNVEFLLAMAKQWQLRGQVSTAMRYYKRIRDLDPDHPETAREIRLYLMRKKKDQKSTTPTSRFLGFLSNAKK